MKFLVVYKNTANYFAPCTQDNNFKITLISTLVKIQKIILRLVLKTMILKLLKYISELVFSIWQHNYEECVQMSFLLSQK